MAGYFHRVHAQTATRFWINNVTREETRLAIEAGAVGCTQNPSFVFKMLSTQDECERSYVYELLDEILTTQPDDNEAQVTLQRALVCNVAKSFLPLYERSGGTQGYVSIQGDPFREDADTIIRFAHYNREAGPNIMAKIPATQEGLKAIGVLARECIPINATEVMSVRQAIDAAEVYEQATQGMTDRAPIYYSHISGIFDEYLQKTVETQKIDVCRDALWQAGIAAAKKTYQVILEKNHPIGFIGGGARGLHHFTEMVGANAAITINWKGAAEELIKADPPVVQRFWRPTPASVIDELCEKLPDFCKGYFAHAIEPHEYEEFGPVVLFRTTFEDAWRSANTLIAKRRKEK